MSALADRGIAVRLPGDRAPAGRPAARHPRAPRPQRGRGDRRRAGDPALHGGTARVAARRGGRRSPPSTTTRPAPNAARTRSSSSTLDGVRVAHFGDFGQAALRPEQRAAIGEVDLLFMPVGGGPTIGGATARRRSPSNWRRLGGADALPDRRGSASSRPRRSS